MKESPVSHGSGGSPDQDRNPGAPSSKGGIVSRFKEDSRRKLGSVLGRQDAPGKGLGRLAQTSIAEAAQVAGEISGEAGGIARDVLDVTITTPPAVQNAVTRAAKGQTEMCEGLESADPGIREDSAGQLYPARLATGPSDEDVRLIIRTAMDGAISLAYAIRGEVGTASSRTAYHLVTDASQAGDDLVSIARGIIEEAISSSAEHEGDAADIICSAAQGIIEATRAANPELTSTVLCVVREAVEEHNSQISVSVYRRSQNALRTLSGDLTSRPWWWRGLVLWRAGRYLMRISGMDFSASLAYYALLSFLPLVTLSILALAIAIDTKVLQQRISELLLNYLPASRELLEELLSHLFQARFAAGVIAVLAMMWAANGLFMATNRAVNRVFGTHRRSHMRSTLIQMVILTLLVLLFVAYIAMSVGIELALRISENPSNSARALDELVFIAASVLSTVLPFMLICLLFLTVYRSLPSCAVSWRDATFGAIVAALMFEGAKNLFFWFTSFATQRSLIYGSLSSAILLLVWFNLAGLIFLYGAAVAKEASDLRPS
jgi:membrane protein